MNNQEILASPSMTPTPVPARARKTSSSPSCPSACAVQEEPGWAWQGKVAPMAGRSSPATSGSPPGTSGRTGRKPTSRPFSRNEELTRPGSRRRRRRTSSTGRSGGACQRRLPRNCREAAPSSVTELRTPAFNEDLDRGAYISQTPRPDRDAADQWAALRAAICRTMRPGEPPTEDAVEAPFPGASMPSERHGSVGPSDA